LTNGFQRRGRRISPDWRAKGNIIPVCREDEADLLTPVAASSASRGEARQPFLLESGEGAKRSPATRSSDAIPTALVRSTVDGELSAAIRCGRCDGRCPGTGRCVWRICRASRGVRVGYLSYDVCGSSSGCRARSRTMRLPDMMFGIYDTSWRSII